MTRSQRVHREGAFYHVMLRGNDGQNIFFTRSDGIAMCILLQQGVEMYEHRIHAFCFMKNHIHLLIQVGKIPLSKIIHNLAFRYSQRINKRNDRVGHLFQGRFKAIVIEESSYFTKLLRYIHLNPQRARIVDDPVKYYWSSHRAYLHEETISWLTCEYGLSKFSKFKEEAISSYRSYLSEEVSKEELTELRGAFKEGQVINEDSFYENLRQVPSQQISSIISLNSISKAVCLICKIDEKELTALSKRQKGSFARGILATVASRSVNFTLDEIAKVVNRDRTSICSLLSRFSSKYKEVTEVQQLIEQVKVKAEEIERLQA